MTVVAKICGINNTVAMQTAVANGAGFVGLVFYPQSPRSITPGTAATLAALVPDGVTKVGLFVDPDNALLTRVLDEVPLDLLQLHGNETVDQCANIRNRFGRPVMKVIKVAALDDVGAASDYCDAVDWLMFDAKAPSSMPDALPGGNALPFDWTLLAGWSWPVPWMLAGGLDADNVATAVTKSGALVVDVSSGVESAPGKKVPTEIERFLEAVADL
ncbi:MAG: phosphoribosylanthranilate isomerase [Alphaproteobacteria bacterium]|nr:phosphoribosylanthranilate isomerase [Alphaproteobacteria bacterium]